jgi:hypothetical protein
MFVVKTNTGERIGQRESLHAAKLFADTLQAMSKATGSGKYYNIVEEKQVWTTRTLDEALKK